MHHFLWSPSVRSRADQCRLSPVSLFGGCSPSFLSAPQFEQFKKKANFYFLVRTDITPSARGSEASHASPPSGFALTPLCVAFIVLLRVCADHRDSEFHSPLSEESSASRGAARLRAGRDGDQRGALLASLCSAWLSLSSRGSRACEQARVVHRTSFATSSHSFFKHLRCFCFTL